jgi:hypothetical protein
MAHRSVLVSGGWYWPVQRATEAAVPVDREPGHAEIQRRGFYAAASPSTHAAPCVLIRPNRPGSYTIHIQDYLGYLSIRNGYAFWRIFLELVRRSSRR